MILVSDEPIVTLFLALMESFTCSKEEVNLFQSLSEGKL